MHKSIWIAFVVCLEDMLLLDLKLGSQIMKYESMLHVDNHHLCLDADQPFHVCRNHNVIHVTSLCGWNLPANPVVVIYTFSTQVYRCIVIAKNNYFFCNTVNKSWAMSELSNPRTLRTHNSISTTHCLEMKCAMHSKSCTMHCLEMICFVD